MMANSKGKSLFSLFLLNFIFVDNGSSLGLLSVFILSYKVLFIFFCFPKSKSKKCFALLFILFFMIK